MGREAETFVAGAPEGFPGFHGAYFARNGNPCPGVAESDIVDVVEGNTYLVCT